MSRLHRGGRHEGAAICSWPAVPLPLSAGTSNVEQMQPCFVKLANHAGILFLFVQGLFSLSSDLSHLRDLWTDEHLIAAAVRQQCAVEQGCFLLWLAWLPAHSRPTARYLTLACLACPPILAPQPDRGHSLSLSPKRLLQGDAQLEVEQRGSTAEGFGKGHRIPLSFGEALRRMAAGDASLYLTTQVGDVGEV